MSLSLFLATAVLALLMAVLPAPAGLHGLREASVVLAFLLAGSTARASGLVLALVFGLLLDCLHHLPLGTVAVPGIMLAALIALLHSALQRRPLTVQASVIMLLALGHALLMHAWLEHVALPAASDVAWMGAILAALLWWPLAMVSAPPDTAL